MAAVKRESWNKNIMDTARKNSSLLPHLNISEKKIMNLQRVITFQEPTSYSPINKNPFKKSNKNKNKLQITNEINRKFSYKNANPDINYYNDRNSNNSNDGENDAKMSSLPIFQTHLGTTYPSELVVASLRSENRRFSSVYDRNKIDKSDMNNSGIFMI
jgi:hypothetical protein